MLAQLAGNVLAVVLALALTASVVMHAVADPPWYRTAMSRHLMATAASFAAVMDLTAVRILTGSSLESPWFTWLRLVVFATAPVVAAWRLWIQVQLHRQDRQARGRGEPARSPDRDGDD